MDGNTFAGLRFPTEEWSEFERFRSVLGTRLRAPVERSSNLHVTELFFKDLLTKEHLPALREILNQVARQYEPISVRLTTYTQPPNKPYLCLGLEDKKGFLRPMRRELQRECESAGIPFDTSLPDIEPHLTVFRPINAGKPIKMNDLPVPPTGWINLDELTLYETVGKGSNRTFKPLHVAPLWTS